jgi:hypothetical protein
MGKALLASTMACTVICLFWVLKYVTSQEPKEADFPRIGPDPGRDDQKFMKESFRL